MREGVTVDAPCCTPLSGFKSTRYTGNECRVLRGQLKSNTQRERPCKVADCAETDVRFSGMRYHRVGGIT